MKGIMNEDELMDVKSKILEYESKIKNTTDQQLIIIYESTLLELCKQKTFLLSSGMVQLI